MYSSWLTFSVARCSDISNMPLFHTHKNPCEGCLTVLYNVKYIYIQQRNRRTHTGPSYNALIMFNVYQVTGQESAPDAVSPLSCIHLVSIVYLALIDAGRQCLCALIPWAPLHCSGALEFGCHQPGIYQTAAGRGRLLYTVAKHSTVIP